MLEIRRTSKSRREISLVPLINVVFLLLIYFIVAGTLEKIELIPIDPPVAESGEILDEGHIVILLGTHEEIIVDEDLVDLSEVQANVAAKLKNYPDKIITLKADASVPAKTLIDVMDEVKAAGGHNLSLVTQTLGQL